MLACELPLYSICLLYIYVVVVVNAVEICGAERFGVVV